MALPIRTVLAAVVPAAALLPATALPASPPGSPALVKPATRAERDHAEAVAHYGLATAREHDNRLLEALKEYEAARRLDPDAAPPHRALARLYLAVDRLDDALAACRRTLELDPDDFETAFLYGRQLRARNRRAEAREALRHAAAVPALKEHPAARAQLCADLAALDEDAGDWAAAEAALRQVVEVLDRPAALEEDAGLGKEEIDAQAAETYERLGRVCLKGGHTRRAVAAFAAAGARDPARSARLAYNLAEVYARAGKDAEALARVEEYLRSQPQKTDGYELRIALQRRLGRAAEVLPALEASATRDRHNRTLALLLAREYGKAGRRAEAEAAYGRLLGPDESPGPEVFRGLFDLYKGDGPAGGERALLLLDRAVEKAAAEEKSTQPPAAGRRASPAPVMAAALREDRVMVGHLAEAARARLRGGDPARFPHPNTCYLLGTLAERAGRNDAAEEMYRGCLGRAGVSGDLEAAAYAGLLDVLRKAHKHAAVVAACKEGLARAAPPNRVLFYYDLSRAHLALGEAREALAAADEAVRVAAPETRLACRINRVGLLAEAGRAAEAVAACQELLKEYNKPDEVLKVRMTLSSAYTAAHEPDKAEEQLELVLKANPANATANNDLGYLWADRNKNLEEAERLVRTAIELDRRERPGGDAEAGAAYLDSLGWVLFRRGDLAGARRELERAAALPGGEDDPVVWDHLGDVRLRQGEKAAAAESWRKALGLYEAGSRPRGDGRYDEIKAKVKRSTGDE